MKCENCGSEMRPGARICHECQYNHLLKRKMGSRQPVVADQPVPPVRPVIRRRPAEDLLPPAPAIPPAGNVTTIPATGEDNLIRFPYAPNSGTERAAGATKAAAGEELPEWRQRVRDKVRESRGKRVEEPAPVSAVPDEVKTDPNPLVESALKRIKRATPSITPLPVAQRGVASAAKALEVEIEEERQAAPPGVDLQRTPEPRQRPVVPPQSMGVKSPGMKTAGARSHAEVADKAAWSAEVRIPAVESAATIAVAPPVPQLEEPAAVTSSTPVVPEIIFGDLETEAPVTPSVERRPEVKVETPPPGIQKTGEESGTASEQSVPAGEPPVRTTRRIKPNGGASEARPAAPKPIDTQIIGVDAGGAAMGGSEKSGLPATFWVRTLAGGCDFEIIAMSFLPIFAAYAVLNTILNSETFFLMLLLLAALTFIYQLVTLVMAGRTYGMAMLNLRLISLTGDEPEKVTRQQLMMRAWAATIAFLIPPINLIVRQTNERRLSLPDLVSNTAPVEL